MEKHSWSSLSGQPMSEQALRTFFPWDEGFRFFPNSFEPGVSVPTYVYDRIRVYVLAGCCKYAVADDEVIVSASEFVDLEKGDYWFDVCGDSPVKMVKVYKLNEGQ